MTGAVSGQCASLCKFNFKDGDDVIEIHPSGFKVPKLPIGSRVEVYAKVVSGTERTAFTVTGMKM